MTDYHNKRYITLVGTPLAQSFAARMQNAGYAAAGLNLEYFYSEADTEHLAEIINGIRYMPSFAGAAITKPNKVAVLELLDELDPLCEKMGACNTVVKQADGTLKGYNTDADGFYKSIVEEGVEIEGKTVFCIGAGGVARPICAVLADKGAAKVFVTDMFEESVTQLVTDTNGAFPPVVEAVAFGDYSKLGQCDVVINASGVGMGKSLGVSPIPAECFKAETFYFDACYNPAKTQFLLNAEAVGAGILNGLGMSLYQGTRQVELWTGAEPPVEAMRSELLAILAEQEEVK